jgi:hypothetical protein
MALKFLVGATGEGTTADAIAAIEYAIENGAHVINASWGGTSMSLALRDAIAEAGRANLLFVAAAGNNRTSNDISPHYPASYDLPNVLSVASSDRRDIKSFFSNFGRSTVHLAAPGDQILSTVPGGGYDWKSGTSMAAPHVTGVAALLLSLKPSAEFLLVKRAILENVTRLVEWEDKAISGGRLNAAGAIFAFRDSLEYRLAGVPDFPFSIAPGETFSFNVIYQPEAMGDHTAAVLIESRDPQRPVLEISLTGSFDLTLAQALDAPQWLWQTGGDGLWLPQTSVTYDGGSAGQSGSISHSQSSWMGTTINGPGTLSFWWKVSSENSYDWLELWVNDQRKHRISGEVDWREQTVELGEGPNVVRWTYVKDFSLSIGADRGWVDLVRFAPGSESLAQWAARLNLPLEGRAAGDRHGPLQIPNLLAYALGLDPRTAIGGDLPRVISGGAFDQVIFVYQVSLSAAEVAVQIETSEDLAVWESAQPLEDALIEEYNGIQFRAAAFGLEGVDRLFLRLAVDLLEEEGLALNEGDAAEEGAR